MIMHISYELFWHMPLKLQKKQVKWGKIHNFVQKNSHHHQNCSKSASKMSFFSKFNTNAKITHISAAPSEI